MKFIYFIVAQREIMLDKYDSCYFVRPGFMLIQYA